MRNVDLLVIGTGSAGQTVAYICCEKGLQVAIVDNGPFGGTCVNRGCDPKKVLVGATEALSFAKQLQGKGITYNDLYIDWNSLMQFKKSFVQDVPESVEKGLKDSGIETLHGTAKFVDKNTIKINDEMFSAKHIVIATGAIPVNLGFAGEEHAIISDDFLELETLPKRIIFIGGGFISFEFAHIARRSGVEVTILHRSEQVLSGFDQDLVVKLVEATRNLGINVLLSTPVEGLEKTEQRFLVHTSVKDGEENSYDADLVVHGAGRVPNLAELDLEKGAVTYEKKGVTVNEYLQSTTNPSVYAAGDACSYGLPLTPVAGKEGVIVAHNILNSNSMKADFKAIPSVVFTIPPLATVGLTEQQAKEKGYDCVVKFDDTSSWYSSKRINEEMSAYKTLVDKKTNKILGAHLLGYNADEVINIFAMAINHNFTPDDLKNAIYSYPTKSSDVEYML